MKKCHLFLLYLLMIPAGLLAQTKGPYKPVPGTSWQYQLSGTVNTAYNVAAYNIDLFDSSQSLINKLQAEGKKVICYFSAGSWEDWRQDATQFPPEVLGSKNGWPGELWLDIRHEAVRNIMRNRIQLAKDKGCDAVEPDNVDGYSNRTGFPLTYQIQLNYNRFLANKAHAAGLGVALKNNVEQVRDLVDYFDFAINEECHQYRECNTLKPFIDQNKAVFNVEYQKGRRSKVCAESATLGLSTVFLPLALDDSFRDSCIKRSE